MRTERDYLDGLVQLHRQRDGEERRALWRQSMATLAAAVANRRQPAPLEGLNPDILLTSVRLAMRTRLVDDLEWLSPPAAAAALYELAAALPPSDEKRELGRRILVRLHDGAADTFVALATRLAMGSRRVLSGAPIRARVALALDLPLGAGAQADRLALALISRRELEREWLRIPATGSLPARRLAARLLERAARETARRVAEGDDGGLRVFQMPSVQSAWTRLLSDRESLVWRHVATARGLLSGADPELADEIERHLDPALSPTEWRRAAASLGASIAIGPDTALVRAHTLLSSPVIQNDPGVTSAMIYGLPRAAEEEPGAVEELIEHLVRVGRLAAAEALVDLKRERLGEEFGVWAAQIARAELREALSQQTSVDDGRTALMEAVADELAEHGRQPTLRDRLADALAAFAREGARAAYTSAQAVLEEARTRVGELERCADSDSVERRVAFRALRDLDLALCETDTLGNLLMLGVASEEPGTVLRPLGDIFQRMNQWLVLHEGDPITDETRSGVHFTLRMRRLRTMLHVIDADGSLLDDRSEMLRQRRLLDARVLLRRVRDEADTPLHRALCATTARACDALVREEVAEVSDVLLAAGLHVHAPEDFSILAEASMVPDVEASFRAYHRLAVAAHSAPTSGRGVRIALDALITLANDLPVASSPRVEALRTALLELGRCLEAVAGASSLQELGTSTEEAGLTQLEDSVRAVAQLVVGARRRLGDVLEEEPPSVGPAIRLLDFCLERALRESTDALDGALTSAAESLRLELPTAIAEVAVVTLERVRRLPLEAPQMGRPSFLPAPPREAPLPPWMPPGRTLGGFYVLRALGAGAVGSVFVARRAEQRRDARAERFALKVPEYDAAAARTLSEDEFLQLFREEAGALLALPQHGNIARFVTFDVGARPKPILVMELVEGPTLERTLEVGDLEMREALQLLDGIAGGLEAMHAVGIGHLDVKPSNVILRDAHGGIQGPGRVAEPVLVDFGLAGRHVRPGCGTAEYGAPELWGAEVSSSPPMHVDVYAFGCMIYEVLTARTLFSGPHETALIAQHLTYDGTHPNVAALGGDPRTAELGQLLRKALRREPAQRSPVSEIRHGLRRIAPLLAQYRWPLGSR